MSRKKTIAAFALLLLVGTSGATHAAEPPKPTPTTEDINQALIHGDAGKVWDIAMAMKLSSGNLHLFEAQLAYDLPLLLTNAKACRDALATQNAMPSAIACNAIAYHAALNMGDAREAFGELAWIKKVGFPYTLRTTGKPGSFGGAFDKVDIEHLADTLPAFSATLAPGPVSLGYSNLSSMATMSPAGQMTLADAGIQAAPAVTVQVNGKAIDAIVDTGMPTALLIDQAHADAFGVKPLVTGLPAIGTIAMGSLGSSLTLGLVDKLVIGPLTLRNVVAFVVPTNPLLSQRIGIGLPLLARFRQVSFGKSSIAVGGQAPACKAPLPLTFASPTTLEGKLVFDATVDGNVVKTSIDTGSTAPLMAGNRLAGRATKSLDGAKQLTRYLKVSFGKNELTYDNALVVPTLDVPDVLVGGVFIAGWDIRFNFEKMSLCFEPRLHVGR